jgi:hypothetical protein
MQAQTEQEKKEHALLKLFGGLDSGLQFLIWKHMCALDRSERRAIAYRKRRLGFRFAGYVSEALEHELYDAVERWWINRNAQAHPRSGPHSPHAIEQRLHTCLRAIVGEVFRLDAADGLNLGAAAWRSVVASLRFAGPIRSGGVGDHWLDQLNACTADGLHHVTVRTAGRHAFSEAADPDSGDSSDDGFQEHRVLRVIYGGPQRFETTPDELDGEPRTGRVDQVLVAV